MSKLRDVAFLKVSFTVCSSVSNKMQKPKLNLSLDDFDTCAGNTFKDLLGQTEFADVTLVSDDLQQIKAHKVILSASSSKFKSMLQKSGKQEPFICLTGVSYSEMKSMVHFMYLGQTEVAQEDLHHFLGIATKFDVKGLAEYDQQDEYQAEQEQLHVEIDSDLSITNDLEPNTDNVASLKGLENDFEFKKEKMDLDTKAETSSSKPKANTGEMLYCEACDYKTNRAFTLKAHKMARHEGVKLHCDKCEKGFNFQQTLMKHKKKKHSNISL